MTLTLKVKETEISHDLKKWPMDGTDCHDCGEGIGWTLGNEDKGNWNYPFSIEGTTTYICEDCVIDLQAVTA